MTIAERRPSEVSGHADTPASAEARFFPDAELVNAALEAAKIGVWSWDLASDRVTWSSNMEAIRGLPQGAFDGTFAFVDKDVHPQDQTQFRAAIKEARRSGAPFRVLYRLPPRPDGQERWVETRATVVMDNETAVRMFGT